MPRGPTAAADGDVDATDGLETELVAQDEHVERHLNARLVVDLAGGRRAPGLVVHHDPACAQRVDVDAVDLPADGDAVTEVVRAERDLELARHESRRAARLVPDELLEVAAQAVQELAPLRRP